MARVAIMQPYFFPYLGYYQLIASVDKFIVYDDVSFIKQGWIARNRILLDGKAHPFSIPLRDASSFRHINETELHDRLFPLWRSKFLKTLELAYRKAPFFRPALALVEKVLASEDKHVSKLAIQSIVEVCRYLEVNTKIIGSSGDYGNETLKGQDRVIDICKREMADTYINAPGGEALYSSEEFSSQGIQLIFIKPILGSYTQFEGDFLPGLSMIDALMFNSIESCHDLLKGYELA